MNTQPTSDNQDVLGEPGSFLAYVGPGSTSAEIIATKRRLREKSYKLVQCLRHPDYHWPDRRTLSELDALVDKLYRLPVQKSPRYPWTAYCKVDKWFSGLHLRQRVEDLICRAKNHRPPGREMVHYTKLIREQSERGAAAKKLLKLFPKLVKGEELLSTVPWGDFAILFLERGPLVDLEINKSRPAKQQLRGPQDLICYVRFLELFIKDRQWVARHFAGASDLAIWAQDTFPARHTVHDVLNGLTFDLRSDRKERRQREKAAERQRRCRAKKVTH